MDKQVLLIFQREIERQCRFALIAFADLGEALNVANTDRAWYSIQALLIAAGNVSKLLWPPGSTFAGRGNELRLSLAVPDPSPLEPRTFRNHFEHFDERLEAWASSSQRHNFVDSNIGPAGSISGPDLADFLRNFDTTKYAVTYRGDTFELRPIIAALEALHRGATTALRATGWQC